MARRRRPAAPVVDVGGVPVELAERCVVEDWLDRSELAALDRDVALVVASGRWRAARRAWLDAHGVARETECQVIPYRAPRWRSQTVPAP